MGRKATGSSRGTRKDREFLNDPERRAQILGSVQAGVSETDACAFVGITLRGLQYHRKRNPDFERDFQASRLVAKVTATKCIAGAVGKNPQIALAYLGRKYPNEWAHRKPDAIEPQKIAALLNQFIAHVFATVPAEYHAAINANANALLLGVLSSQNSDEGDDDG